MGNIGPSSDHEVGVLPCDMQPNSSRAHSAEAPVDYVAADGMGFCVRLLNVASARELSFVRTRLERETAQTFHSLWKSVLEPDLSAVFVASLSPEEVPPADLDADWAPPVIGAVIVNTSDLRRGGAVGISWVTVLFAYRKQHVGRLLVSHAEQYAASAGARCVQVPAPLSTNLFKRLGYMQPKRRASAARLYAVRYVVKWLISPEVPPRSSARAAARDRKTTKGDHASTAARRGSSSAVEPVETLHSECSTAELSPPDSPTRDAKVRGTTGQRGYERAGRGRSGDDDDCEKTARATDSNTYSRSSRSGGCEPTRLAEEHRSHHEKCARTRDETDSGCASSHAPPSKHSRKETDIPAPANSERGPVRQWFNYSIPSIPPCVSNDEVFFRMALPTDAKEWKSLLLVACKYNMGGCEMVETTMKAACRIVAVKADDGVTVVGLVAMQEDGWVSFIACSNEYRSNGLGSFLLFLSMEWLRVRKGRHVRLTPLNRHVMDFYYKWGFSASAANGKRPKSTAACDLIMERVVDSEVLLLPDGKKLKDFIVNYDTEGEVSGTSPWLYYFYTPRKTGNVKKEDSPSVESSEMHHDDNQWVAPLPVKTGTG